MPGPKPLPFKPLTRDKLREELAAALRRTRSRAKLSQDELAWQAGIHRAYMGNIEQGKTNITVFKLQQVCQGLGVKPSQVLAELGL